MTLKIGYVDCQTSETRQKFSLPTGFSQGFIESSVIPDYLSKDTFLFMLKADALDKVMADISLYNLDVLYFSDILDPLAVTFPNMYKRVHPGAHIPVLAGTMFSRFPEDRGVLSAVANEFDVVTTFSKQDTTELRNELKHFSDRPLAVEHFKLDFSKDRLKPIEHAIANDQLCLSWIGSCDFNSGYEKFVLLCRAIVACMENAKRDSSLQLPFKTLKVILYVTDAEQAENVVKPVKNDDDSSLLFVHLDKNSASNRTLIRGGNRHQVFVFFNPLRYMMDSILLRDWGFTVISPPSKGTLEKLHPESILTNRDCELLGQITLGSKNELLVDLAMRFIESLKSMTPGKRPEKEFRDNEALIETLWNISLIRNVEK